MKRTRPSAAEKRGVLCYSHPRLSKPRMRECRLAINRCARFLRAIRRTTAIRRQRTDRRQEWASPADKPWAPAVSSYKDPSHVPSPPVHPMEDHPAGRALPARRGRLAGRPFGLPHAAQQRAGEKRQYTDARRIGAPAPGSPRGIAGVTHPALFHGCLPVRQGLLPADPVPPRPGAEALPRCLRPARRPDPPGAHRARRQSRGARPVRGLRTQCAGRQGRTVRRPARPGQQRQGTLLPVLGAGHAGTAGIRVDDRVRTRRHQQRAQRRGLQRLVHLPEGKRATLRARSLLRQGRRTPTADDQHRLSPRTGWQGDRRDGPGHQPEQPAGAQRTGQPRTLRRRRPGRHPQPGRAVRRQQPRRRPARQEPGQGGSAARRRTPATAGRRQEPVVQRERRPQGAATVAADSRRQALGRAPRSAEERPARPGPGAGAATGRHASRRHLGRTGPRPRRRGARPAGAVAERPRRDPADPRRRPHAARHRQRRRRPDPASAAHRARRAGRTGRLVQPFSRQAAADHPRREGLGARCAQYRRPVGGDFQPDQRRHAAAVPRDRPGRHRIPRDDRHCPGRRP
ncbi:hypothetical protein BN889_02925 [Pseudomonas aeruginosa PA38182]|nr:hypothetical protein BN889_02925 [Pseudomonas aeruginosa PA38182]